MLEAELVVDAGAAVGEGPVWDPREKALWWVDIPNNELHRFDPGNGSDVAVKFDQPIGAVAPRKSGGLVGAFRSGFGLIDTETFELHMVAQVEANDLTTRMNDGKCDPSGRFWAGTMSLDPVAMPQAGSLYCLEPDGQVRKVLSQVTISNGIDWSPAGTTMYFIDSLSFGVDAFDFDPETGGLSNRRRLVSFPERVDTVVCPDGMCIDADDHLWVAVWGGSAVMRFAPDGTQVGEVQLPVSQVTSCTFGGDDYSDLYVTTASQGLSADELARQPGAGGVYRIRPGQRGLPANTYLG